MLRIQRLASVIKLTSASSKQMFPVGSSEERTGSILVQTEIQIAQMLLKVDESIQSFLLPHVVCRS